MKLTNEQEYYEHDFDVISFIEDLKEKYRTVYWTHIYNNLYIYKPLGRMDFREICENEELDDIGREDAVVKSCLLYPEIDLDNIEAGIVAKLCKKIMKDSYLDSLETRAAVLDYFRSDMYDTDNQITCIINEAFPNFDIEEIENWDIERTAKYLSRAEWKLQNFRGAVFNYDVADQYRQAEQATNETERIADENGRRSDEEIERDKMSQSNKKEKMTPEKLAELKAKFPEINWEAQVTEQDMKTGVDTLPVALRPGGY